MITVPKKSVLLLFLKNTHRLYIIAKMTTNEIDTEEYQDADMFAKNIRMHKCLQKKLAQIKIIL